MGVLIYNQLVRYRNLVREALSGMDVQLKRRHDLIPNIVNSVAGYQQHEKNVLTETTRLRSELNNPHFHSHNLGQYWNAIEGADGDGRFYRYLVVLECGDRCVKNFSIR